MRNILQTEELIRRLESPLHHNDPAAKDLIKGLTQRVANAGYKLVRDPQTGQLLKLERIN